MTAVFRVQEETVMQANASYKRFIDELVDCARDDTIAIRIRSNGHSERTNDDRLPLDEKERQRKDFFLSLSPAQKEDIAKLIQETRESAIHDIASFLEGQLSSDGMKISWNGEEIAASPYASMHYDYVCRLNGDSWPDE
jgi:hypothetical protein